MTRLPFYVIADIHAIEQNVTEYNLYKKPGYFFWTIIYYKTVGEIEEESASRSLIWA